MPSAATLFEPYGTLFDVSAAARLAAGAPGNRVKKACPHFFQRLLKTGARHSVVSAGRARLGGGRAHPGCGQMGRTEVEPRAPKICHNHDVFGRLPWVAPR